MEKSELKQKLIDVRNGDFITPVLEEIWKDMRKPKKTSEIKVLKYEDEDVRLTNILMSLVKENFEFVNSEGNVNDFEEMNRLRRIDKRDDKLVEFIIRWSQQDSFWRMNIRSVKKLRKQFESLMVKAKGQYDQKQVVSV